MCCSVGYNDGHTLLAVWDQASWLLLCSTETHIWKNPVSHFSPLPVLHKQNIGLRGWFLGLFFFCTFYSVNSVHVLMQRRAESCQPNQNFSWHHEVLSSAFCSSLLPTPGPWLHILKFWVCFQHKIISGQNLGTDVSHLVLEHEGISWKWKSY